MVEKLFGFLYRETSSLNRAALLLGLFAFSSQVLAFFRDRLLAHIFGAGVELDIYYAAFRIPDFLFITVASIVSLSVLVPFIIEKEGEGNEVLRRFVDQVFSFFGLLMIGVSLIAFFFMPQFVALLFKGFSGPALEEVVLVSRILLLSPIILGFSNLFGSLTQAYNRFTIYALAPLLYNLGIILGVILLGKSWGVRGVALGVIFGALLHVLIQIPFVARSGLLPRFTLKFSKEEIARVIKISLPRTLTLSMSAITLLFLVSFASLMAPGSISVISFSNNLQSVPLSLIGVSYSLAAFPTLTRRFKENNLKGFIDQIALTSRFIIFWSLPLTALIIILRAQIVRVILGTGQFDWSDTRLTAAALALFTISAVFQSWMLLLMRGFYSAGFTKKPFYINLVSTVILILSTWGLVKLFYASGTFSQFITALLKVTDLSNTVVLMLPLGFSIGTIINGLILWAAFEKEFKGFSREITRSLFDAFSASVIMGGVAYWGLNLFANFFDTDSLAGILLQGGLAGILGIAAGIVVLVLLKNRELSEVWSGLHSKFWRTRVIVTDPEIV